MRYRLMGRSGLRVSEVALGTMTFGEKWGFGEGEATSREVFEAYLEAGGNFIDTANKYHEGESERFVGAFMHRRRDQLVVATKYSLLMDPADPNAVGNGRKNLVRSVEDSLARMRTDYIDLLWLHAWDDTTPVEEVMRGLDDLVRAGKVLYVGVSDTPAWVVSRANTLAELRGWTPFVGLQIPYSLIERDGDRELLPMADALGLEVTAWGSMGGGVLTGKYTRGETVEDSKRAAVNQSRLTEKNLAVARAVDALADELGVSSAQVAVAWVKAHNLLPILGARTAAQLRDSLRAVELELPPAAVAQLDALSAPSLGFPREFLERMRGVVWGELLSEKLDFARPGQRFGV